jgi:hypothetical protein
MPAAFRRKPGNHDVFDLLNPKHLQSPVCLISRQSSLDCIQLVNALPAEDRMSTYPAIEACHHEMNPMMVVRAQPHAVLGLVFPTPASRIDPMKLAIMMTAKFAGLDDPRPLFNPVADTAHRRNSPKQKTLSNIPIFTKSLFRNTKPL